jgi:hypothetical protein
LLAIAASPSERFITGRIVVHGTSVINCDSLACEPGVAGQSLHFSLIPDKASIPHLPRWKRHDNDIWIDISNADRFIRSVTTVDERKRLIAGRLPDIRGQAALLLDHYEAGLDCDSANSSARFVGIAQVAKRANLPTDGDYGCGSV